MREALAVTLAGLSSLKETHWNDSAPVDRLHAIAAAQIESAHRTAREAHLASLGASFTALKGGNRSDEYDKCIERLVKCLTWTKPKPAERMRFKVARQAIQESMIQHCPRCQGTKEIPAHDGLDGAQRMKPCPDCFGSGVRRYSNRERIEAMEVSPGEFSKAERYLAIAISYISAGDAELVRSTNNLLDRWNR